MLPQSIVTRPARCSVTASSVGTVTDVTRRAIPRGSWRRTPAAARTPGLPASRAGRMNRGVPGGWAFTCCTTTPEGLNQREAAADQRDGEGGGSLPDGDQHAVRPLPGHLGRLHLGDALDPAGRGGGVHPDERQAGGDGGGGEHFGLRHQAGPGHLDGPDDQEPGAEQQPGHDRDDPGCAEQEERGPVPAGPALGRGPASAAGSSERQPAADPGQQPAGNRGRGVTRQGDRRFAGRIRRELAGAARRRLAACGRCGAIGGWGCRLTRGGGRKVVWGNGRSLARGNGRNMARGNGRSVTRDSGRSLARDSGRSLARDSGRGLARSTGRTLARDSGRSVARDSGRRLARSTGISVARDSGRIFAQASGGWPVSLISGRAVAVVARPSRVWAAGRRCGAVLARTAAGHQSSPLPAPSAVTRSGPRFVTSPAPIVSTMSPGLARPATARGTASASGR